MKKFIIVLALIVALFSVPKQPPTEAPEPPQTAIVEESEQVPDEIETSMETTIYGENSAVENMVEELTEESLVITETRPWKRVETVEEQHFPEIEAMAECINEGDQSLAEYKPQIGGQPNPFENDTPTEINDRPVEDYVGEGEDRPGEGIHF